jgi:hypothetical protein
VNLTILSRAADRCRVVSDAAMLGAVRNFTLVLLSWRPEVFLERFACLLFLSPLMTALPQRHPHKKAPDAKNERYYGQCRSQRLLELLRANGSGRCRRRRGEKVRVEGRKLHLIVGPDFFSNRLDDSFDCVIVHLRGRRHCSGCCVGPVTVRGWDWVATSSKGIWREAGRCMSEMSVAKTVAWDFVMWQGRLRSVGDSVK